MAPFPIPGGSRRADHLRRRPGADGRHEHDSRPPRDGTRRPGGRDRVRGGARDADRRDARCRGRRPPGALPRHRGRAGGAVQQPGARGSRRRRPLYGGRSGGRVLDERLLARAADRDRRVAGAAAAVRHGAALGGRLSGPHRQWPAGTLFVALLHRPGSLRRRHARPADGRPAPDADPLPAVRDDAARRGRDDPADRPPRPAQRLLGRATDGRGRARHRVTWSRRRGDRRGGAHCPADGPPAASGGHARPRPRRIGRPAAWLAPPRGAAHRGACVGDRVRRRHHAGGGASVDLEPGAHRDRCRWGRAGARC